MDDDDDDDDDDDEPTTNAIRTTSTHAWNTVDGYWCLHAQGK
jgi:hypothetical protein